ncbi:hypothetical protein BCR24_09890 [Enterococcus ureilyticus]|uniref:LXG domain-containing protein n=3 Tax=Enterococcus ureilyticus TaxID=1131292 RepID=A0A1E5H5R2_9ENTE|nr:hypothetical protein [Enterococcus ureilyticus]MBM7688977.1 hypothetical protein [Enterococcus ureilyticus]OEG20222.1 hypothetical protein BCR24_09890 [Enterococcus ureilyticus]
MSIDMYLGPSKTQGSTTTSVCNNYQSGLTGLQEAISNFTADQVLRSLAYDSAKGYFQEAYVPLIQGAILVVEATAKAVEKLPTDYVAQVDSCDLKSSELEREIQQYEVQIQGMQEQIEQVKELLPVSSERVQHIREANGLISDYTNAKAKLEKQLQKLLAFHAFSTMIFVEVTSLKNAIDQGLAQVSGGKGFNAQKGTFSNGNLKDRSWMDTIGKKWQEREKERLKDQMPNMDGLEYKQIDFNGGKVWCWVKEGHTTADPEDIEKTFLYNDWVARMLKKYGSDYFTPEREPGVMDLLVEQNLRLFEELRTGIDSKTGKKLTPLERLARGTSLANSLAALGVGAKQITNVGRGKSSQSPTKSPIINRGPRVNDIGKSNKTITVPGKKIQSVKGKPSKVKAPGKASGANSPKTDFGAENPVSGKDWNNYFKNKYGAGNVHWKNPVSSISELMDTPGSLINVNPADVTDFVKREGWTVTPLKKGGSAGIPYESSQRN